MCFELSSWAAEYSHQTFRKWAFSNELSSGSNCITLIPWHQVPWYIMNTLGKDGEWNRNLEVEPQQEQVFWRATQSAPLGLMLNFRLQVLIFFVILCIWGLLGFWLKVWSFSGSIPKNGEKQNNDNNAKWPIVCVYYVPNIILNTLNAYYII